MRSREVHRQKLKQDAGDYEQNTPEYTYQRNETVFSLRIGPRASRRDSKQNRIIYIIINEYSGAPNEDIVQNHLT